MNLPAPLRYRDFRLFVTGGTLSAVGTQFTTVAMAWQIYELTNSAFQVGLLGLGRAIPQIALAVFGGILADSLDRRRLMMALQVASCFISTSLAILTAANLVSPGGLLVAATLLAFVTAVETPTRQAVVPNLVDPEDLRAAIAFNVSQRSLAQIAGPAVAGVVLASSGPLACYAADAFSWLAMLGALALIRRPLQSAAPSRPSLDSLLAGVQFVRSQQVILAFMILDFGATFFGSSNALLPVYARDILNVGPQGLGLLYAATSVGALAMGAALSGPLRTERTGLWICGGVIVFGACTVGFALSHVFWLSVLLLGGTGAGNMVSAVLRNTSNQTLTPDHLRGRVGAVNAAFVAGGPQLGQFESGVVASLATPQISALTGGVGAVVLAIGIVALPVVRHFALRASPTPAAVVL